MILLEKPFYMSREIHCCSPLILLTKLTLMKSSLVIPFLSPLMSTKTPAVCGPVTGT